ncbi:MAG TPA: hypothetical protein VGP06_05180 [Janthinobacterium sp.]|nr:hypothetical protein [Janthinobacterium sp.]
MLPGKIVGPFRKKTQARRPSCPKALRLTPLLLALGAGQVAAVEIIVVGPPGASGFPGAFPGAGGGAGQAAAALVSQPGLSLDALNRLTALGGAGGAGGAGAANASGPGGAAGAGGAGGATTAAMAAAPLSGPVTLQVAGTGGAGGAAGLSGIGQDGLAGLGANGGTGGAALVSANSFAAGAAAAASDASAIGGAGGMGQGAGYSGGAGASAAVRASASSAGGSALVSAIQQGGAGGAGAAGADGGAGAASVLQNGVSGAAAAALGLTQTAVGGQGGASDGGLAGVGGAASSSLSGAFYPAASLTLSSNAVGGAGGMVVSGSVDINSKLVNGGAGGAASVTSSQVRTGGALNLTQAAYGGAGGDAFAGRAGNGGGANTVFSYSAAERLSTLAASVSAVGGNGGTAHDTVFGTGQGGNGGSASSVLDVYAATPMDGGLGAIISGSSSAVAGGGGDGFFVSSGNGGSAFSQSSVNAYGTVFSSSYAGGPATGLLDRSATGRAIAIARSNYSATAYAAASGGSSTVSLFGTGGVASASASSHYLASATATSGSGSGRFGSADPASASASADVTRLAGDPLAALAGAEARAHASSRSKSEPNVVSANASLSDEGRSATAIARVATIDDLGGNRPDVESAVNVGGPAYGAWVPGSDLTAVSYASSLPGAASVSALLADAPRVAAAFAGSSVLGAGTQAGTFFGNTMSGEFRVPFEPGQHLLLGFFSALVGNGPEPIDLSIDNFGTLLYAHSFTSVSDLQQFFDDRVLDLGILGVSALDLTVTTRMPNGRLSFSYLLGAGDAVAAVPEADSWLLLLPGLALVVLLSRRKRGRPGACPA